MPIDARDALRESLRARVDACLERLDDVVTELMEVHGMPPEEVIARVEGLTRLTELELGGNEAAGEAG